MKWTSGYLLNFFIYIGTTKENLSHSANQPVPYDNYKNQSKVVLSLIYGYRNKEYFVTLNNYFTSPKKVKALLVNKTGWYGALCKKQVFLKTFGVETKER